MEVKKSYYAIIPASVRYDKELPAGARLLYGELTALSNEKGYCWATNSYFAELYGVTAVTISNWITGLEKQGHIHREIIYKEGSKEIKERRVYITPVKNNFNTPIKDFGEGVKNNFNTPIKENFKENNTSFNNTSNTTSYTDDDDVFNFYQQNFGTISPYLKDYIISLTEDYGDDLTLEAMKIAVENKARSIKYVNAVLRNWASEGIKTVDDIKAAEKERKRKKDTPSGNGFRKAKNISSTVDVDKLKEKFKEVLE